MEEVQIEQIRVDLAWRIRHEVMYPTLPYDAIKLDNDKEGIHFGLFTRNRLTAVVSVFNKGKVYQFRKFATIESAQGKGYGSLLLNHIINYMKDMGAEKIWCNARVSAAGFYEKFGLTQTDQRTVSNGIDFVIMELQLNN
ncbi:GNAT family N-acetyltransferase [Pedobacter nyackensis]|uniref:Acetyltransferase (GNAT) domain-containing protein n=1 Tax=Pedobacter nyackensis TaxID=475255 RepID=A0A1W2B2J2_9SPHI|nr:GNAT family N-acetyltransferase [Pedobacter nyackensis]SMC66628.1 Acetyltransferase (GNAT) domain-containing protein [Pedobacter nyackensis]